MWTCGSCQAENPSGTRFCGHCGAAAEPEAPTTAEALRSLVTASVADRIAEEGGQLEEERRLITALFADVSGFTALADRLDPEELLEVIDPVVSRLSSIVGRFDGFVEKFAGDALLALFGAPVSHEDDADRALIVALDMHRELARICEELGPNASGLTLHVGVNSGHGIARLIGSSVRTDYGVLGDSVILAQRLESAAPPGETYVSDATRRLTSDRFEFEAAGELTLKGKAEPVTAWRLVGQRRAEQARSRAVVGRERELAAIEAAVRATTNGERQVLAVLGEPGVGKSTVIGTALRHAETLGVRTISMRSLSYGAGLPYWPLADVLRREAHIDADTPAAIALARVGETLAASSEDVAVLAEFLGLETGSRSAFSPEATRRRLQMAFVGWFEAIADPNGLVIAIEDLHWTDSSTLEVIGQLARTDHRRITLLLSARPEARDIARNLGAEEIALEPMGDADVAHIISSMLGDGPPGPLVEYVVRRAGGNPFFVEELVRALRDRGTLVRDGRRWIMKPGWDMRDLPPTIEEVLAARIDLLPHRAGTVLQAAAVIGRRVRTPLLREVAGDDAEAELDGLIARGLLDRLEDDLTEFHHALVQDVAYDRLLRRRRRELHGRVAAAAENLYGSGDDTVDLLARHLYLAGAPNAVEYLLRAGRRAARLFANHEAIQHLERALELSPGADDLRLEVGRLHDLVGDYDRALELFGDVRDRSGEVEAWRGVIATLRRRGDYEPALAAAEGAFHDERLLGSDLTPLWLEQAWTLSVAGRPSQAIDVARAGLAAARDRRTSTVGELLTQLARAESIEGNVDEAIDDGRAADELFREMDDVKGRAVALRVLGDVYRLAGRMDEASTALHEGLALAERVGSAEELGGCLINLGMVELERGNSRAAIALTRRAIEEFERVDHGSGRAFGYSNLAWACAIAADFDEAMKHAEDSLAYSKAISHPLTVADTLDTMAYILLATGEIARAGQTAEEAAALFIEMGMQPKAREALQRAAQAWDEQGDGERARATRARAQSLVTV